MDQARGIAAQFVIAAALCGVGAWFVVIPSRRELREVGTALREQESRGAGTIAMSISDADASRLVAQSAIQRAVIQRRSELARNESALFGVVTRLAAGRSVRLDQMDPVASTPASTPPAPLSPALPPPPKDTRVAYSLQVSGTYGAIAGFIRDLQRQAGYASVRSIRLTPTDDRRAEVVRATIVTEHIGVTLTAAPEETR